MLVGIRDPAIVLFLKIVIRQVGIAAAPQPELLNELLAFFVRLKLKEGGPLFRGNDVDHVFTEPLFVGSFKLFQTLFDLLFLLFIQFPRG